MPVAVLTLLILLLWGIWSLWILVDDERRGLFPPLMIDAPGPAWRVVEGVGENTEAGIEIQRPGRRGEIAVLLDLPNGVVAEHFDRIVVRVNDAAAPNLSLEWSVAEQFSMVGQGPVIWQAPGHGVVVIDASMRWQGEPRQLMLRGVGFTGSWLLASVELHPRQPDFWGLQQRLWQRIYVTAEWQVRNINRLNPVGHAFEGSVTLFLAVWAILGLLGLLVLRQQMGKVGGQFSAWWWAAPIVLAWLVLDLRWQIELIHKAHHTITSFSQLDREERGQTELDADLFEFSKRLEQVVERRELNRVFVIGDRYASTRLRYRLAAWGARAISESLFASSLVSHLEMGDLVILDDWYAFKVLPDLENSATGDLEQVVVESTEGEVLMRGEVILKQGQYWALQPSFDQNDFQ